MCTGVPLPLEDKALMLRQAVPLTAADEFFCLGDALARVVILAEVWLASAVSPVTPSAVLFRRVAGVVPACAFLLGVSVPFTKVLVLLPVRHALTL